MFNTAKTKGIERTLIDGVYQDVNGIKESGYRTYTKGKYMVTGKARVTVDIIHLGVQVRPGDKDCPDNREERTEDHS